MAADWYVLSRVACIASTHNITGSLAELLRVPDEAMHAYELALSANPQSIPALNASGMLLQTREAFDKAVEFFRAIVGLEQVNGEAWGNLGTLRLFWRSVHC